MYYNDYCSTSNETAYVRPVTYQKDGDNGKGTINKNKFNT